MFAVVNPVFEVTVSVVRVPQDVKKPLNSLKAGLLQVGLGLNLVISS
jgi:hypothetical protein